MTLIFMIKKKYLAEKIIEQEKTGTFHERREYKRYWRARIGSTHAWRLGGDAVFLCGRYSFLAEIQNITIEDTPSGIEDAVKNDVCYNIECKFLQSGLERLSTLLSNEQGE